MSLINRMLQDLDKRHALAAPEGKLPPRQVRAVTSGRRRHEWFWRVVALLMVISVVWVLWVAYQLQPKRALATDFAFKAADAARRNPTAAAPAAAPAAAKAPETKNVQAEAAPAAAPPAAAPVETLRMAQSISTPIPDRPAKPVPEKAATKAVPAEEALKDAAVTPGAKLAARSEPPAKLTLDVPQARIIPPPTAAQGRVEKRERERPPSERAEAEFRRAAGLLNQGRVSEAEEGFAAALAADASHAAARQALVALLLELRRVDEARRQLQETLAVNPAQPQFALVLARIFVGRGEHAAALEALKGAQAAAGGDPEFNSLLGTVLARMARHREAADAYRSALRAAPQAGNTWIGLGMSLEALEARPEAAEAFRRALGSGSLGADLKLYAEQRVKQLQ